MSFPVALLLLIFSYGTHSLDTKCYRRERRQTKIMKLKPQAQSSEGFQFIKVSMPVPPNNGPFPHPTGFVERFEPLAGTSVGKEVESSLLAMSARMLSNLQTKLFDRCIIVGVESTGDDIFESFQELCGLTAHAGLSVISCESQKTASPNDDHIFGDGKIKQIAAQLLQHSMETVVFDGELSPIQLRNLEDSILNELPTGGKRVKVIDRTSIILDIMAKNSKSAESSMQAELALAIYRLPRMTSMWGKLAKTREYHLSIGCRLPSGKNLDLDFKQMRQRISYLKRTLDDIRMNRTTQRQSRKSQGLPSIAIVGYIGSGKTSLQNALSSSLQSGYIMTEEDAPFKTLEAVTRRISVPKQEKLTVSNANLKAKLTVSRSVSPDFFLVDTMSLISRLPACVKSAFKMNFDELENADILVNVCDVSNPMWLKQEKAVLETISEIEGVAEKPLITVWNMLDCFSEADITNIQREARKKHQTVAISALTGLGFDDMLRCFNDVMVENLMHEVKGTLSYSPQNLALLSKLQQTSSFDIVEYTNEGIKLVGKIPVRFANQFTGSIMAVKVKARAAKNSILKACIF
jgi:GTPase